MRPSVAAAAAGALEAAARRGGRDAIAALRAHLSPAVAQLSVRGDEGGGVGHGIGRGGERPGPARRAFAPTPHSFAFTRSTPQDIIADSASGCIVTATDGRAFLDMAAGIGVVSTGHCHPRVSAAVAKQAATQVNAQQNLFAGSVPLAGLIDRLLPTMPTQELRDGARFFFANSGSEAVDNAVKIARAHTKRPYIITFEHSFHGRTLGAMALTNSKTAYRAGFGPTLPGVAVARYPACLRCVARAHDPAGGEWYGLAPNQAPFQPYAARRCCNDPLESLRWLLKQQVAPSEVAAILVEPILGEGGFLTPPPGFLDGLRAVCDEIGALLILDEVQSGVARSGAFWAHSLLMEGAPDAIVFAKGIASGFPLAGVAARAGAHAGLAPGSLGGTYGANPLACAAGVATLDVIRDEGLAANAAARGAQLSEGLVRLAARYPIIDVRGRGLMCAAEFGGRGGGVDAEAGVASRVATAALGRGLMVMTAGARETLRFLPPLVVSAAQVEEGLAKFEGALGDVFG